MVLQLIRNGQSIEAIITSTLTGEVFGTEMLFGQAYRERWDVETGIAAVQEHIEALASAYFEKEDVNKRVMDYDSVIARLNQFYEISERDELSSHSFN